VTPAEFLEAVWGGGPHSLCWLSLGGFRFTFADSPGELLERAAELGEVDTWFGVHPLKRIPAHGRGDRDDILEVVALAADLDWAHPTRRTEEPLPTEAEVRARLGRMSEPLSPAPPSIVVHSGHGLQPWWLLTNPVSPEMGEQLMAQLGVALGRLGLENGRPDLASILRLPGTCNWKG
jgi:hypothetical protein